MVLSSFKRFLFNNLWMPSMIDFIVRMGTKSWRSQRVFFLIKTVFYSWLIVMTLRLYVLVGLSFLGNEVLSNAYYTYFDLLLGCFRSFLTFFDPYMVLAGSLTPLYALFVDYALYFMLDERARNFFHDHIFKNSENFWSLNFGHFLANSSEDKLKKVKDVVSFCGRIWSKKVSETELTFEHRKLKYLPGSVSKQIRAKMVLLTLAISVNLVFTCVIVCKFFEKN